MQMPFPLILAILIGVLIWIIASARRREQGWTDGPRACIKCGQVHPQHAKFCRHCGRKLV